MKKAILYALCAFLAACTVEAWSRTWSPEGAKLTEHYVKIEFESMAVSAPGGTLVRLGDAWAGAEQKTYEVFDADGDGKPDYGRDPANNKFYKITGWTEIPAPNQRSAASFLVDVYRNDPLTPMPDNCPYSGQYILERDGSNAITRQHIPGTYQLRNLFLLDFVPAPNMLLSQCRIAVRMSSDWKIADFRKVPGLRYEMVPSKYRSGEPIAFAVHIDGTLIDVLRWLVLCGTRKFITLVPADLPVAAERITFEALDGDRARISVDSQSIEFNL